VVSRVRVGVSRVSIRVRVRVRVWFIVWVREEMSWRGMSRGNVRHATIRRPEVRRNEGGAEGARSSDAHGLAQYNS